MDISFFIHLVALLFSFFVAGALLGAAFSAPLREAVAKLTGRKRLLLFRSTHNPILKPGTSPWTAESVMNPAAAVLGGRTHLIYRAIGMDGISRLGYASSPDGIIFDKRLPYPAYVARNPRHMSVHRRYSPVLYLSGGSWGGCEDPRMVVIEDRVYVTFNMFDGWDFIRVAAISISVDDFLAERFAAWKGPYILSKPYEVQKNWVLFPQKIGGRFAVLHSVAPNIEIAFCDSIEAVGKEEPFIESWVGSRGDLPSREGAWDSFVRGAGPPPLRTNYGWLLFYHAIDERDPGRYKLGAMLLDLVDPTKVLYRAAGPVLSPDKGYENHGKPGIVYACGAVVRGKRLFVYYGGADKVVCVATAPLHSFLDALMRGSQPSLAEMTPAQAA
ncbi:hypothetical protein HY415_02830 [Candidatus Kaiserbacteria bacterium]|nr:hypothetical protein [Candidatus Kaiserbacteria bacterium]